MTDPQRDAQTRIRTEFLSPTQIMLRDAQGQPMKWEHLDEHLRDWLTARAKSRELPPGVTV